VAEEELSSLVEQAKLDTSVVELSSVDLFKDLVSCVEKVDPTDLSDSEDSLVEDREQNSE